MPPNRSPTRLGANTLTRRATAWAVAGALVVALLLGDFAARSTDVRSQDAEDDWRLIDARGNFSFLLPPDMEPIEVIGFDSYVGEYRNDACHLSFDYGYYSNPLGDFGSESDYTEELTEVGGQPAKLVTFTEPDTSDGLPYRAAIHVADVGVPPRQPFGATRLTMFIRCREQGDLETAQRILRSIAVPER